MPAKSKSQQRLFGMVHAYQRGKLKDAPEEVKEIARSISDEDAEHFAKTKHRGLPEKKAYELGFMDKCAEYGVDPEVLVKVAANPRNVARMVDILADGSPEKVQRAVQLMTRFGHNNQLMARVAGAVNTGAQIGSSTLSRALSPALRHEFELSRGSLIRALVNGVPRKDLPQDFPWLSKLVRGIDDAKLQRAVKRGLKATGRKDPIGYVNELVMRQHADNVNSGYDLAKFLQGKSVAVRGSSAKPWNDIYAGSSGAESLARDLKALTTRRTKGPAYDGFYPGRYEKGA